MPKVFRALRSPTGYLFELVPRSHATPNAATNRALTVLADVLRLVQSDDHMTLLSIMSDMEPGSLPDIVAAYFNDPNWGYESAFHLGEITQDTREQTVSVGTFTCEAMPETADRLLRIGEGFRWSANLGLAGIQVHEQHLADVIRTSLFDGRATATVSRFVRLSFNLGRRLDTLNLHVAAGAGDLAEALQRFESER